MAGKRREDVREEDVTGLKYFDKLAPLLRDCTTWAASATRPATASCTSINTAC